MIIIQKINDVMMMVELFILIKIMLLLDHLILKEKEQVKH